MKARHTFFAPMRMALLCASATLPTTARADSAMSASLEAFRRMPGYKESIYKGAQNTTAWINNRCDGAKAQIGNAVGNVVAPAFDAKGQAQSGAWIEHVTVTGCNAERVLNVLFVVKEPGKYETTPMLPGSSRADPRLQKDGSFYAFTAAQTDPKGCKPIYLLDTQFLGFSTETPLVPGKPGWSERWTVAQCDKHIPVTLHFTPDPRGTIVSVGAVKKVP